MSFIIKVLTCIKSFMPIIGIYVLICKTLFAERTIKEENSGEAFICKKKSDIKSCGGVRLDTCREHVFLKMSHRLNHKIAFYSQPYRIKIHMCWIQDPNVCVLYRLIFLHFLINSFSECPETRCIVLCWSVGVCFYRWHMVKGQDFLVVKLYGVF